MPGGTITLHPDGGAAVTAIVAGPPQRSGGVGGWQSSERAQRRPAKWFRAPTDESYSLDLILDAQAALEPGSRGAGRSVEERLAAVRKMGMRGELGDDPPSIKLTGDIWKLDRSLSWVMDEFTLGDRLYNSDGTLRRQQFSVTLSRFEGITELEAVRIQRSRTGGKNPKPRRRSIRTKQGDTLRAVALRELGAGGRWVDLRKWNKSLKRVNPDATLRPGTKIAVH